MKVLKRDASIQEYNLSKIEVTLANISDEYFQPLTDSDLSLLTRNIQKEIEKEMKKRNIDIIKSSRISQLIVLELEKCGFDLIAEKYREYLKNVYEQDV